jgi:hypothetical protein
MFADSQLERLALLERVFSSISLVSVLLIFVTYGSIPRLRNPRNTFIVFASIANLGASIGTVISRDGLTRGEDSALCRAQSFLVHVQVMPWCLGSYSAHVLTSDVVSCSLMRGGLSACR